MKPKEKAKEVFDKIGLEIAVGLTVDHKTTSKEIINTQKKCAFVVVDEILDVLGNAFIKHGIRLHINYWKQVKKEIDKL